MHSPTVSIIMNCYNNASTLTEAFQSLATQTFEDWEVIFWDNNSHDDSLHIAKSFAKKLSQNLDMKKMHCYGSDTHMPLGQARNAAIARAKGKYLAFLDCDDIWLATKLEKQVQLMQSNANIALVCTNAENFYANKVLNDVFSSAKPERGNVFAKLMQRQWITMSSAMLRSEHLVALRGQGSYFDEKLNICEEAELFYALAHEFELDYIDEVLTRRRIHNKNATFMQWESLAKETEYILQKQYELYPHFSKDYPQLIHVLNCRIIFQKAVDYWCKGQGQMARKILQNQSKISLKHKLFYVVSYLPPVVFPYIMRMYLRSAKYFV